MRVYGEQRMHLLGREKTELKVERVANGERGVKSQIVLLSPFTKQRRQFAFLITFCNNQRRQMASTDFELQYSKKEQTMLDVIYIDRTALCVYVIYNLMLFILFFFE